LRLLALDGLVTAASWGPLVDVSMRRYATTTAIPRRAKIKNSGRQLLR
jgi:hypothetical protein